MCFAPQRRALFRHFFDIWTSKSGPNMVCFVHFDFKMCFVPQRRALFRHRNTSKSGPTMMCFAHFDFKMCFAPQRRALFRHLNFQKWSAPLVFCPFWLGNVLRATTACTFSCLIWPAGSAPAALASLLSTSGATNQWKNTVNRDFPIFRASTSSFFWSFLSDSFHLCFSTVHIVGSFTSKLPSIKTQVRVVFTKLQWIKFNKQNKTIGIIY